MKNILFALILIVGLSMVNPAQAHAQTAPEELGRAVQAIESLDQMRSGLASSLKDATEPPTLETFKEVCKPVGMQAQKLSEENGWEVKQVAKKYRNPDHAPKNLQEVMALAKFEQNPELMGFWQRESSPDKAGTTYYRRINVEATCLACHGAKNARPDFVKDKYPQDLAFDFKEGDLRGMYSVFIPYLNN
jgi:cytochrome c553